MSTIITPEMVLAGAIACSQWVNGTKREAPLWDQLCLSHQSNYLDQSRACIEAALKVAP